MHFYGQCGRHGGFLKISLITVSYNSSGTIKDTLESVEQQCYPELEYIVVDGGSRDATLDIVHQHPTLITRCISEADQGIYDAMNKGLQLATGEVVGIINSDDFYLSGRVLHEVAALFAADSELEAVLGGVDFVSIENLTRSVRRYSSRGFRPWMLRFGFMPPHPAVFVRKSACERVGLYKLGYKIAADFDWLTRLILVNKAKYQIVDKIWVRMRIGGASTSGLKSNMISTNEMKKSLKENGYFASRFMLMCRFPYKFLTQVFCK